MAAATHTAPRVPGSRPGTPPGPSAHRRHIRPTRPSRSWWNEHEAARAVRAGAGFDPVGPVDGVAITRWAGADDAGRLTEFYESLDPESRYRRFLQPLPKVRAALAEHVLRPPNRVLVALDDDGAIVAEVVLATSEHDRSVREIAYAVAPSMRRRGLAREMVRYVLADAARRGVDSVRATIGSDNRPSVALMKSLGARTRFDDGAVVADLDIASDAAGSVRGATLAESACTLGRP